MIHYQVGGSLTTQSPSYITRQADTDLYQALKQGEFCYVFNARQMGKSSLLVRTKHRLERDGDRCTVIDMTNIGSENITPEQWYKGLITDLWRGFKLFKTVKLDAWKMGEAEFSLLQQLSHFIEAVLTAFPAEKLVIFIDEVDSILGLPFPVDDFFALIRFCYNQRSLEPAYQRLAFALFGVATPSELIQDLRRTPFNIGRPIHLSGFTFGEAQALTAGLTLKQGNPESVLKAILTWTNGQPFLTQKLCQLVLDMEGTTSNLIIPPGNEAFWVESLVRDRLLKNWQSQDEPEHLRTIRNRILNTPETAGRLLGIYQQVLQTSIQLTVNTDESAKQPLIKADDSPEQTELILSGLVIKQGGVLQVKNRIYQDVFNTAWVEQQLNHLRPYSQLLAAWIASRQQDESRLLRGQSLQDAQKWAFGKQLSDLDYRYLAASVESNNQAVQQTLEAQRTQAVEARLGQEQKARAQQRRLLGIISGALLLSTVLGILTFGQYQQAKRSEQLARRREVEALISASLGNHASHQRLRATVNAIQAYQEAQQLDPPNPDLTAEAMAVLRQALYTVQEANQITLDTNPRELAMQPGGKLLAAGGSNGKIYLLQLDGTVWREMDAHAAEIETVVFSPDGQWIASTAKDQTAKLWQLDGTLVQTLGDGPWSVEDIRFSPDGRFLLVADDADTLRILQLDGTFVTTLVSHNPFSVSPDGQLLATVNDSGVIQLWRWPLPTTLEVPPTLVREIDRVAHQPQERLPSRRQGVRELIFSPDSQMLAITGADLAVEIRASDGTLVSQIPTPTTLSANLAFTPDSQQLVTASDSTVINLWNLDGTLAQTLQGHQASVSAIALTPDGQRLVSTDSEGSIRFWQWQTPFVRRFGFPENAFPRATIDSTGTTLMAISAAAGNLSIWQRQPQQRFPFLPIVTVPEVHRQRVHSVAVQANGQQFATGSRDGTVKLWNLKGENLATLESGSTVWDVAFSPDDQTVAIALRNGKIQLWQKNSSGEFQDPPDELVGHQADVRAVNFSLDGQFLVSASADQTLKLWRLADNTLLQTLTGHQAGVYAATFSPDGQGIASGSADRTLRLWQTNGSLQKTIVAHRGNVSDVVFSSDGKRIFTASRDRTAKIWNRQGQLLRSLPNTELELMDMALSADDQTLMVTGIGSSVMLWSLSDLFELNELDYACDWIQDYLATLPAHERTRFCH
ncbi:MAG: AAA-like domain-containing protein [Cyanobacteria bacterium P01_G01_bin.54]